MADNPLDEMAKVSAADSNPLGRRVDKERRVQGSARFVRWTCRYTMWITGSIAIVASLLNSELKIGWLQILVYLFLSMAAIAVVILFFMGGLATSKTRFFLPERLRRLIDD